MCAPILPELSLSLLNYNLSQTHHVSFFLTNLNFFIVDLTDFKELIPSSQGDPSKGASEMEDEEVLLNHFEDDEESFSKHTLNHNVGMMKSLQAPMIIPQ